MRRIILPFTCLFILVLSSNLSISANPIYTLAPGEEFVYGKIGTFEDGSIKYTLAIVRKRNENKTFYRMGFRPYHPDIVQGSGNLKPYDKPKEYSRYDVYLIFNGQKFGPYDEIYDMNFLEPNPDKWVSNDGKTISFCAQKANKFMGVVHNSERSMFWVPSQHLNIDPDHNEDIFTLEYAKNDIRMYIDGIQVHQELNFFGDIKHADNGDLLYFAKNRSTNEGALYLNHKKILGSIQAHGVYGFIKGTNTIYYRALLPNQIVRICFGNDTFDFSPDKKISSLYFVDDYIAFNVEDPKSKNTLFYEYNLKTHEMSQHGPYEVTRLKMFGNKLAYQIMHQTKESDGYAHTYYFRKAGGELIEKYYVKPNSLDWAYMKISPKGDIYIIKEENKIFHITKNGKPYPFNGTINRILFEDFLPSTDELVLLSEVKLDMNHSYNNDVRLNIGADAFNYKGSYFLNTRVMAADARVIYTANSVPAEDEKHVTLNKNGQNVLNTSWKFIEKPVIDSKGEHFAVMVFNYNHWMTNSVIGYYPDNACMHQDWHLVVDGKELEGNYGAPTYLKSSNTLAAISQEENNLIIKDLLSNKSYSDISNQVTHVANDKGYVKFQNDWKRTYINIETGLNCSNISPDWYSAMWVVEPSEDNYVKIKNRWKGTYLHIEGGLEVQCTDIQPGWHSAMWLIEPIDGTNQVRIKNRWKGTYLNMEYGQLKCTDIQPGWLSARWHMVKANN